MVPASIEPAVQQILSSLRLQLQSESLLTSSPCRLAPVSGAPGLTFQSRRPPGVRGGLGNVPPARLSTGTGASVMTPSVALNPPRDHALGRQPVVVGLQGPGIGLFTNNLAIQFRQGSAASKPDRSTQCREPERPSELRSCKIMGGVASPTVSGAASEPPC